MVERGELLVLTRAASPSERTQFDQTFLAMQPRLLRLCARLAGAGAAEDLVHETYLRGRSRLAQLRDSSLLEAWLTRIAVNACHNHRRGAERTTTSAWDRPGSNPTATNRDVGLMELVERLPPRDRTVLVLFYGYGYDLREIGDLLSITHANARSILSRTRRHLARAVRSTES